MGMVSGLKNYRTPVYDTERQVTGNYLSYAWETLENRNGQGLNTHVRDFV